MYIDGDTHYWPVRFIDRVDHPGRGHVEIKKRAGEVIRYGEKFPGDAATYYRDGKKIILSVKRAGTWTSATMS
jgi:hypothetical protein